MIHFENDEEENILRARKEEIENEILYTSERVKELHDQHTEVLRQLHEITRNK